MEDEPYEGFVFSIVFIILKNPPPLCGPPLFKEGGRRPGDFQYVFNKNIYSDK